MKTLRLILSPIAGAAVGAIINLLLIAALALLTAHLGPWWAVGGKWGLGFEMLGEQVVMFGLSGAAAGAVTGLIVGRESGRVLGMLAGLLTWMVHLGMALSQGGAEAIMYLPGLSAALYGVALGAVLVGGNLGARLATRGRRR